jgi:hypothetical protein
MLSLSHTLFSAGYLSLNVLSSTSTTLLLPLPLPLPYTETEIEIGALHLYRYWYLVNTIATFIYLREQQRQR